MPNGAEFESFKSKRYTDFEGTGSFKLQLFHSSKEDWWRYTVIIFLKRFKVMLNIFEFSDVLICLRKKSSMHCPIISFDQEIIAKSSFSCLLEILWKKVKLRLTKYCLYIITTVTGLHFNKTTQIALFTLLMQKSVRKKGKIGEFKVDQNATIPHELVSFESLKNWS